MSRGDIVEPTLEWLLKSPLLCLWCAQCCRYTLQMTLCLCSLFSVFRLRRVLHLLCCMCLGPREHKLFDLAISTCRQNVSATQLFKGGIGNRGIIFWWDFLTARAIRGRRGVSCPWSITTIFKLHYETKANERRPETSVTWLPDAEPSFQTPLKICFTPFHEKLQRYPNHGHNTSFFFLAGTTFTQWRLAFFRHWELSKWTIPVPNWLRSMAGATVGRSGMVTILSLEVQGPGSPYPSFSGASNCMFGVYAGTIFQKTCHIFYFPEFSVLNKHIFLNMIMFWFLFDRQLHTKQLPPWWMVLSQFTGSLSSPMASRS